MKLITLHLLGPQEGVGGKLHVFMSTLPKLGLHALTPRQAGPATDNQQKQMALLPAHKGFQQMAEAAAEHQVLHSASVMCMCSHALASSRCLRLAPVLVTDFMTLHCHC